MRLRYAVLLAGLMLAGPASGWAENATGTAGDWTTTNKSIVRVYNCGSQICLKIVQLSPDVPEKTDGNNPDADQRTRPLCGLDIGTGFRQVDAGHLADGHIYDPESGRTYSGTIAIDGDEMKLHGFIGISLLGRTETWHRAPAAQGDCH